MRFLCAVLLVCFAAPAFAAEAEVDRALEQRVKAAYLYRFTEFVTWPVDSFSAEDAPLVIAIAGSSGFADEVASVTAGRSVDGRRLEVRRLVEPGPSGGFAHILFIPASERGRLVHFIRAAGPRTLVVTETQGALSHGSVINFVLVDGRVRFEVSLEAAEKRALKLSARMLAVAQSVRGGP
jgi:hypothetical protein